MDSRRLILLPLVAGCLLAACGGGDDDDAKGPPGSESNPIVALPNPTGTRTPPVADPADESARRRDRPPHASRRSPGARDAAGQEAAEAVVGREQQGGRCNGRDPTKTERKQKALRRSASRPCSLVSKTQAAAIVGTAILEPLEAPQGPTCIYQTKSGSPYITLAVQTVNFTKLRKQIRNTRAVSVADRTAYCGTYGKPMLFLPLTGGRVLSITASCGVARRFAARAAPHL